MSLKLQETNDPHERIVLRPGMENTTINLVFPEKDNENYVVISRLSGPKLNGVEKIEIKKMLKEENQSVGKNKVRSENTNPEPTHNSKPERILSGSVWP